VVSKPINGSACMAKPMSPLSIHWDSKSILSKVYSHIYNGKSRYIRLRHAYVHQLIKDGVITIDFVQTSKNLADPLTKGIARDLVLKYQLSPYL